MDADGDKAMFIRTERLFLRPAWSEDATELTSAIAQEPVARMLARMPWPYDESHARDWIESPRSPHLPSLLVTLPVDGGRIVGGCGLHLDNGKPSVGYWIAPHAWGRGYASEAVCALVSLARLAGHQRLFARHLRDNAASGRVLRKAGFRQVEACSPFPAIGRPAAGESVEYELDLTEPAMCRTQPCCGWPGGRRPRAGILAAA